MVSEVTISPKLRYLNCEPTIAYKMQKLILKLYDWAWGVAIPLLKRNPRLKDGYAARTLAAVPRGPFDIWIQAASAGEAYLAASLIKALPTNMKFDVLVTTNTRQGMEILEKVQGEQQLNVQLTFFPFDKPGIMDSAVLRFDPQVMVLLETELWPGLLSALHRHGCKILMINARMTPKSLKRYRLMPRFWKALAPHRVLAISGADADRFTELFGRETVSVMPNIKFDRVVLENLSTPNTPGLQQLLPQESDFLVMGSVRQEEEPEVTEILGKLIQRFPDLVIGIFPRHMHRLSAWKQYLGKTRKTWICRSEVKDGQIKPGTLVLWDTFGELNVAYSKATAVFVGGSLAPLGGQNFLEPLIHGVIPVIGPSWENFAWVGDSLFSQGLVRKVQNWEMAVAALSQLIETPPPKSKIQDRAAAYVKKQQGGTNQACRLILQTLTQNRAERRSYDR